MLSVRVNHSSLYLLIIFFAFLVLYANGKSNNGTKAPSGKTYRKLQMIGEPTTVVITLGSYLLGAVHIV